MSAFSAILRLTALAAAAKVRLFIFFRTILILPDRPISILSRPDSTEPS
jgi:hypothetical protein